MCREGTRTPSICAPGALLGMACVSPDTPENRCDAVEGSEARGEVLFQKLRLHRKDGHLNPHLGDCGVHVLYFPKEDDTFHFKKIQLVLVLTLVCSYSREKITSEDIKVRKMLPVGVIHDFYSS